MTTPPMPPGTPQPPSPTQQQYGSPPQQQYAPLAQQQYGAVPPAQYGAAPPSGTRFAGFWIRLLAYLIDSVIVGAITFGLLAATKPIQCLTNDGTTCIGGTTTVSPLFYLILLLPLLYFVITWALGGTVGQRLLGLRVINAETGGNLGIGRSLLRLMGYLISTVVLYIGLIWAAFDSRKQGWHDKIGGSLVVHRRG